MTQGQEEKAGAAQREHLEGGRVDHLDGKIGENALLYDAHGMLLIPQPTDRSDDPLVTNSPDGGADRRPGVNIESYLFF